MNRVKCATCGLVNFEGEEACRRCGASLLNALPDTGPSADADNPFGTSPLAGAKPTQPTPDAPPYGAPGASEPPPPITAPSPPDPTTRPMAPPPPAAPPYGGIYAGPETAAPGYGMAPPFGAASPFGLPFAQTPPELLAAKRDAQAAFVGSLLGLVGFCCCFTGVALGAFAIYKGNRAKQVFDRYGVEEGRSMAVAAIAIGGFDIFLNVIVLVAQLARQIGH